MLASIPADVSTRLLTILSALALVAVGCGSIPEGEVVGGEGSRFVPFVAEFLDDAGLGASVAVDAEGVPVSSYWIFPAVLAEGEIPVGRPIGAPYITTDDPEPKDGAAIGLASVSADGVWTRGAAAQVRETPTGVYIPYGPAFEKTLIGATAENTNGTDVAIDDAGGTHVVWTGQNGVYYAGGTDAFSVEQVYDYDFTVRQAGPIGRASVAVDADGNPWVAYTVNANGQQVRVATASDEGWRTQTVATIPQCAGCPQPMPTRVGVTSAGPTVAWVDTDAGAVMASVLEGDEWVATEVAGGVSGQGLDMAVDADGNALLTFYDDDGGVQLARQSGTSWSLAKIADARPSDPEAIGNLAPATGIAVDDGGAMVAAWDDAEGVVFATSDDGETFTPVETLDTAGGRSPSVGISPDGANVYVAWYDVDGENLRFGVQGDVGELAVAAPSPTVNPADVAPPPTGGGGECGADGEILLDIEAQAGNTFSTDCLVAAAGEGFTINYSNADTVPHNIDVYIEQGGESLATTDILPGPLEDPLDVDPLDAGEYYFQCDVHPTTMFGTLAVAEGK
jgi:plastocyanin